VRVDTRKCRSRSAIFYGARDTARYDAEVVRFFILRRTAARSIIPTSISTTRASTEPPLHRIEKRTYLRRGDID
jgi:hypothetical protein